MDLVTALDRISTMTVDDFDQKYFQQTFVSLMTAIVKDPNAKPLISDILDIIKNTDVSGGGKEEVYAESAMYNRVNELLE